MPATLVPRSPQQRLLLFSGFSGLLFISTYVVLGLLASPYHPLRDTISALEFTSLGLAQRLNFICFGLLLIAFALALRHELGDTRGSRLIPLFQALSGLAVTPLDQTPPRRTPLTIPSPRADRSGRPPTSISPPDPEKLSSRALMWKTTNPNHIKQIKFPKPSDLWPMSYPQLAILNTEIQKE